MAVEIGAPKDTKVQVQNFPADQPTQTTLESVRALLAGTLTVDGSVSADVDTSNLATDAKLELVRQLLAGTITVDGSVSADVDVSTLATQAKLETVRALLAGILNVQVDNLPASYPDQHAQGLTRTQLDQGPVGVTVGNDPAGIALTAETAADLTSAVPLVITPASGRALRLWWVMVTPDPDNDASGYVTVNLAPHGDVYVLDVVAHRQRFDGGEDEPITVSVTGAGAYRATVHFEEYEP
jgi:hypothetical protein